MIRVLCSVSIRKTRVDSCEEEEEEEEEEAEEQEEEQQEQH